MTSALHSLTRYFRAGARFQLPFEEGLTGATAPGFISLRACEIAILRTQVGGGQFKKGCIRWFMTQWGNTTAGANKCDRKEDQRWE